MLQPNKVFTRFVALLLVVVTSLLLTIPAFAAYGTTPTYATGNYTYSSSTTSGTTTSSADWFTAVLAQLRTMYSFIFTKLTTINTAVGLCESYLAELRDNSKELITMDTNIQAIWNKLNTGIAPDVSSIKNDTSSIKTLIGTSNTNTSSIYSQVLKLASEVTAGKILTAVESISTDGLATEATLSDLNSRAATESTLSSVDSKVATDATLSAFKEQLNDILTSYTPFHGTSSNVDVGQRLYQFSVMLSRLSDNSDYNYALFYDRTRGSWRRGNASSSFLSGFKYELSNGEYKLNLESPMSVSLWSLFVNRLDNLVLMNYRLVDQLADAEDEKLKDATEDRRTTVTDYIKSDGTNDKYADSLGFAQTVTGNLDTGTTMSDANSLVDGILGGDTDSDYWSWFTQATADDLDQSSGVATMSLDPDDQIYWVINPYYTADDYVGDWRSSNG